MKLKYIAILAVLAAATLPAVDLAGDSRTPPRPPHAAIVGTPGTGASGVTRSVRELMARPDPFAGKKVAPIMAGEENEGAEARSTVAENPLAPRTSAWPLAVSGPPQGDNPLSAGVSFLAAHKFDSYSLVPDTMGDVGPTQIFVTLNGRFRVFDKQGNVGALDMPADAFWADVRENNITTDPQVRYDRLSQRWFVSMITYSGFYTTPNRLLLAVSSGPEITETTTFTFYGFEPDAFSPAPNEDTGAFADFDGLGVDANAVYLSANMYRPSLPYGPSVYVIRKSSVLAGGPLVATPFRLISTYETGGIDSPRPCSNDDPNATEGYFVGDDIAVTGFNHLNVRKVIDPGGTPSLSADIPIAVPPMVDPVLVAFLGSGKPIQAGGVTIHGAGIYANRISGERSLWTSLAIRVDASGISDNEGDRDGARWFEIADLSSTPVLRQMGTIFDPVASQPRSFIYPSVAMSGQGTAVIGCTSGGPAARAQVSVSARLASDPLGTSSAPEVLIASTFSYNLQAEGAGQRWGDYSQTVVDPTDGMTFWTFQEYCDGERSWAIRVVELKAPPPPAIAGVSPATVGIGSSVECTVTANEAGYFDAGEGLPKRLAVEVGGGVTVESVRLVDAAHVAFTLVVAPDAAMGPRDVTVVNPDGQSVVAAGALDVGPLVSSVRVGSTPDGSGKLVIKGAGFASAVSVLVDGVAFAGPARAQASRKVVQKGSLANGLSIEQAIPRGRTVLITIANATGGTAQVSFVR